MRFPSFEQITNAAFRAVTRFPFTVLAAVVATGALMWLIEDGEDPAATLWMTAQLGIPLLLVLEIASEKPLLRWGLPVVGIGLLYLFYSTLDVSDRAFEYRGLPRFLSFLAVAHLLVAVVPYLNKRPVADFWTYNKDLLIKWLTGAAFAAVLFITLGLAILAVEQLFNFNFYDSKIYGHLFIVLAFLFVTIFFLHHFPAEWSFDTERRPYARAFEVLCKYILIPVMLLYAAILISYILKIVTARSLPNGVVSYLVLGFSVVGILTYLLNYRLPEYDEAALPRWYKTFFWWALLPAVVLMLVSIGRRISDYGITEPRYAVATAGAWLLAICAYFIVSRKDNIKFIPISLALVCFFVVVGPFSAFRVSERSQVGELKELLEKSDRWENGKMKPSETIVPDEDIDRINSILYFFGNRERLDLLEQYMPYPLEALPKKKGVTGQVNKLQDWLNLEKSQFRKQRPLIVRSNLQIQVAHSIRGYDLYFPVNWYDYNIDNARPEGKPYVRFTNDRNGIEYGTYRKEQYKPIETFDLSEVMADWYAKAEDDILIEENESIVVEKTGRRANMMLILDEAYIDTKNEEKLQFNSLKAEIFVRTK